jgi:polyisoprenoid-binding protein YceI
MATTKWAIDATHSEIQFKVKHLLISKVTGQFQKFDATVETEGDNLETAKVNLTADVNSISTNNEQRDAHLKNNDFFDADNHAQLTFVSDKLEKIDDEHYKLHGTLTIRGVSKQEVLNVEFGGMVQDPWGNTRVGFTVTGKINRKDYGVSFGMISETGGALLGYDVEVHAQAEFVKVAEQAVAG